MSDAPSLKSVSQEFAERREERLSMETRRMEEAKAKVAEAKRFLSYVSRRLPA